MAKYSPSCWGCGYDYLDRWTPEDLGVFPDLESKDDPVCLTLNLTGMTGNGGAGHNSDMQVWSLALLGS